MAIYDIIPKRGNGLLEVTRETINLCNFKTDFLWQIVTTLGISLAGYCNCRLVLHGCGILYKNQAFLFLAPGGVGKSTFCAAFSSKFDCVSLSEDILMIDENGSLLYTGIPYIRLNKDSAYGIDIAEKDYILVDVKDKMLFYPKKFQRNS